MAIKPYLKQLKMVTDMFLISENVPEQKKNTIISDIGMLLTEFAFGEAFHLDAIGVFQEAIEGQVSYYEELANRIKHADNEELYTKITKGRLFI